LPRSLPGAPRPAASLSGRRACSWPPRALLGKPFLYGTTKEFLVHFGLNSLKDLPPLEEFEETFGAAGVTDASPELSQATLDAVAAIGGESELTGAAPDDREETFLREVADLEEAVDSVETE
jgi:hypothetical protein